MDMSIEGLVSLAVLNASLQTVDEGVDQCADLMLRGHAARIEAGGPYGLRIITRSAPLLHVKDILLLYVELTYMCWSLYYPLTITLTNITYAGIMTPIAYRAGMEMSTPAGETY